MMKSLEGYSKPNSDNANIKNPGGSNVGEEEEEEEVDNSSSQHYSKVKQSNDDHQYARDDVSDDLDDDDGYDDDDDDDDEHEGIDNDYDSGSDNDTSYMNFNSIRAAFDKRRKNAKVDKKAATKMSRTRLETGVKDSKKAISHVSKAKRSRYDVIAQPPGLPKTAADRQMFDTGRRNNSQKKKANSSSSSKSTGRLKTSWVRW